MVFPPHAENSTSSVGVATRDRGEAHGKPTLQQGLDCMRVRHEKLHTIGLPRGDETSLSPLPTCDRNSTAAAQPTGCAVYECPWRRQSAWCTRVEETREEKEGGVGGTPLLLAYSRSTTYEIAFRDRARQFLLLAR